MLKLDYTNTTFTEHEVNQLLKNASPSSDLHDIILLAYRTGMRKGEILALRIQDIFLNEKMVCVTKTMISASHTTCSLQSVKLKTVSRKIDLDDICVNMLRMRIAKLKSQVVFPTKNGGYKNPQTFPISFVRLRNASGVARKSFHYLRHTHAAFLLSKGIHPRIVSERLGYTHKPYAIDIPISQQPAMRREVINILNQLPHYQTEQDDTTQTIGHALCTEEQVLETCGHALTQAGTMRTPIAISNFEDFLSKFNQFYFAFDSIQPALCLEYAYDNFWAFECGYSRQQLNTDIVANKHLFSWQETAAFYYPNTNMFSGSNAESNIKGYVVTIKTTKG